MSAEWVEADSVGSSAGAELPSENRPVARAPAAQPTAPYLEAVTAYGFRGSTRLHVPGHKGGEGADPGLRYAIGDRALLLDVPLDIEGIDIGPSPTPYERAELLAAEAYGAERTWFLTNGASQGNHALCLALAGPGTHVVLQRNSHASLIDGLILSGGTAGWVAPEYDVELGMAHGVTPEALERALQRDPNAHAAFIVSPTYYGMAADVAGCAEVAHRAGAALIVDNAWGSHFGFHAALPESPLVLGADATLASTHKIVGSLTQSAMLHVAHTTGSTSARSPARYAWSARPARAHCSWPRSMPPAASSRSTARRCSTRRSMPPRACARRSMPSPAARCSAKDSSGVRASPDRIRCASSSTCAARAAAATRWRRRCVPPTTSTSSSRPRLRSCSCSGWPSPWTLWSAWPTTWPRPSSASPGWGRASRSSLPPAALQHETVIAPREAFLGSGEAVPVDEAIGRISCESIAGYPPGVPALLPGERVTADVVSYLRELTIAGARLHGAADPTFATLRVLIA